jgi:HSP20 family protein
MFDLVKKNKFDNEEVRTIRPLVDIAETEKDVMIDLELPGVLKDSVNVQINGNTLTIDAQKKRDPVEEKHTVLYQERYTQVEYHRAFELNAEINQSTIKADLKDGVLRISFEKSAETQPKKIEIKSS